MHHLTALSQRQITLLIGPRAQQEAIIDLTAVLALRGRVRVIDGGNNFDPYRVARAIRRRTHRLDEMFARVTVARAFTCYQAICLLEQTPATDRPHLICDLTATFYDEAVSYNEGYRLLRLAMSELRRLSRRAPVVVTARDLGELGRPTRDRRSGLLRLLKDTADQVLLPNAQPRNGEMPTFEKLASL